MALQETILRGQDLSQAQQRLVLDTILSIQKSTYFCKSMRFPALLEYIVRHSIEGNSGKLKERTIGIDLFDRPENYDASNDPVVRVAIAEVRKRLALYYGEHLDAQVRIDLPVGHYEPEFHVRAHRGNDASAEQSWEHGNEWASNGTSTNQDATIPFAGPEIRHPLDRTFEDLEQQSGKPFELPSHLDIAQGHSEGQEKFLKWRLPRSVYIATPIVVVALLLAIWGATRLNPALPIDRFWAPVLNSPGPVLIALAVPSQPNASDSSVPDTAMGKFLTQQANYPIPDISAANSITSFLASRGKQSVIGLARSTTLSELHRAPTVVLGSSRMNQWVLHLGADLHFRFQEYEPGPVHWIQDMSNPTNRRWAVDLSIPYNQITNEYALITREFNSTTGQWWIGIGSTTGLGTIGAEQMLMDPNAMKALNAQLPKGWDHKNLQIVAEFKVVDGSLGASHVVATYLW